AALARTPPCPPGNCRMTLAPETSSPPHSGLYRRVWRWHFYAGLACLPFLALMALTGGTYLFREEIEAVLYSQLRVVPTVSTQELGAGALVARALASVPGEAVRFVAP